MNKHAPAFPPARILVIDDNADIHSDFRKILSPPSALGSELAAAASALFNRKAAPVAARFSVDTALQGQQGVQMVRQALQEGHPYEVAFVDMRMPPGWDGLETIVHCWEVQPSLLVIICTAFSDYSWDEINQQLAQSDRFLILKKPFDNVEVFQLASALASRARVERELSDTHEQLVRASRHAGMAEVATGVLHNVGNVLNSVNVSATLIQGYVKNSRFPGVAKVAGLLAENAGNLAEFLTNDSRGRQLPAFLSALGDQLEAEQATILAETKSLATNIEHIKEVVSRQQAYANLSGVIENLAPAVLVDEALAIKASGMERHRIEIVRDFAEVPLVAVDRHKTLQILINLFTNAKHAIMHQSGPDRRISIRIRPGPEGQARIEIHDTGEGISAENLTRIFQYGFTTKEDGHGFGLHSGANAAREMGGLLSVASEGPGRGATFTLELPAAPAASLAKAA